MKRPLLLAAVLVSALLLAACGDDDADTGSSPSDKPTTMVSESPTPDDSAPPVAQTEITPDDYLVENAPAPDPADRSGAAESAEYFHYAFWTDDTKAVRCDIHMGGFTDGPYVGCFLMPGVTPGYALPAGTSTDCDVYGVDGYEVDIFGIPADGGYDFPRASVGGCADYRDYPSAAIAADTLVLPSGIALDFGPFRCSVADAVATCEYAPMAASVSLGVATIAIVNP